MGFEKHMIKVFSSFDFEIKVFSSSDFECVGSELRILNLVHMELAFEVSFLFSYENEEGRALLIS